MQDTCSPTTDEEDPLDIPAFLRVENRPDWGKRAEGVRRVDTFVDPVAQRQKELRDALNARKAERIKEKNARGFARMQEKHPNERYDRKRKIWVPK